ncbi:MAG: hypothetical protein CM1200mP25_0070 [Acidobacteriota bacterium]|nr:MAG: hypothetical protein CM1200mP25_0070 [Acidobacteriota bacterium]
MYKLLSTRRPVIRHAAAVVSILCLGAAGVAFSVRRHQWRVGRVWCRCGSYSLLAT